jgi:uncharacterized protein YjdB
MMRMALSRLALLSVLALGCGGGGDATGPVTGIGSVALSQRTLTIGLGSSTALDVEVLDASGAPIVARDVFWSSSDPTVAKVSQAGLVTGVSVGTAQIAATIQGRSDVATLTVAPNAVASVLLTPLDLRLAVGAQGDVRARLVDAAGATLTNRVVTYVSSNTTVATVDSTGHVTAVGPGSSSITATSEGRSAAASVTVSNVPVASVRLSPTSASVVDGQSTQLAAETRDAANAVLSGRVVTWSSSAPAVATVSSTGTVVGVTPGSATITATSEGKTATAAITVTPRPVSTLIVSPTQATLVPAQTVRIGVQLTDAIGAILTGRPIQFQSSNTAVATVASDGTVTAVAVGSAVITVTSESKIATVSIVVSPVPVATVNVSPSTASVTVNTTVTLSALARDASGATITGRTVAWSSSAPSVATVNASGVVTGVSTGTATIVATVDGQVGSATITVRPAPVVVGRVAVSPATATIKGSGPSSRTVQLSATAYDAPTGGNVVSGATFVWTSSDTRIATVSSSGLVMGVGEGKVTISATSGTQVGLAQITVTKK